MKLASLRDGTRDGTLIVVTPDLQWAVRAQPIAHTMQAALDDWENLAPRLQQLAVDLVQRKQADAFAFDPQAVAAPLPRAYQWCDGSAFLNHGRLMEKAFNLPPMPDFETIPCVSGGIG